MGAEEVASSAFLCRSGLLADASSRVVGTGEAFLVPLVFRSPHFHPQKQQFLPLSQEIRFLMSSTLRDIKKTLVPSVATRRPVLS
jgi:hypothetical protein